MGFSCGIVGLPNVGKSTLFNALTRTASAQAANYPFCTIEPNIGDVAVPDPRLDALAAIAGSVRRVPARMRFTDIAGLVKGAASGDGLGNRFLGAIRSTDAIVHVVRCFDHGDIAHVGGVVDPVSDVATIRTELMLADLESLHKRLPALHKKARGGDEKAHAMLSMSQEIIACLDQGRSASDMAHAGDLRELDLLTAKPVLYVANVEEAAAVAGNEYSRRLAAHLDGEEVIPVTAAIEAEIAQLDADDQEMFLSSLGTGETGLARLIRAGYALLGLHTFFTAGPKETRAWTLRQGMNACEAAGRIHGDFVRGFICAELASYDDYIACGGEQGARDAGKLRQEGRDYVIADGDVIHFRHNV